MAGTSGFNFVAGTKASATEVNQNFEWFRGHYLPVTQSGTWANTTATYDLGSSSFKFRDGYFSGSITAIRLDIPSTTTAMSVTSKHLQTSSGSSSAAVDTDITLNDYSFFPSFTNSGGSNDILRSVIVADPNDTTGRMHIDITGGGTAKIAWRYMTSSDNPAMWVMSDKITGEIKATWASDDPTPGNVPGLGSSDANMEVIQINRMDLNILLTDVAQDHINAGKAKATTPDKEAFRILNIAWPSFGKEVMNRAKINVNSKKLMLK